MPRKLTQDIRVATKYNEDGTTAREGYVISAADKKWESKLNDAGLDAKDLKRLEDKGAIVESDEDEDEEQPAPAQPQTRGPRTAPSKAER